MKPLDFLLLSFAIGLTAFTLHVLAADDPLPPPEAPAPLRNPTFRRIVLHHSATHGGSAAAFERDHRARLGGLAYHFIVGNGSGTPDGRVETGYRWRDQVPGPHTTSAEVNRESIAVCLVGDLQAGPPTLRQLEALLPLLERLCRDHAIPAEAVGSHREASGDTLCPGRGLPMPEIRSALARRLLTEPRGADPGFAAAR